MNIKKHYKFVIISLIILTIYFAISQINPHVDWLSTENRNIVDTEGNIIVLRGVNIAGLDWGVDTASWNPKATKYAITKWKANVIRTRLIQKLYQKNAEQTFIELEKQIINPAIKHGAYVIIHPRFNDDKSFPDENGIVMWRETALRYKDTPNIIYDIFSEPHDVDRAVIKETAIKTIEAIREVNPRSLILVAGADWGREVNFFLLDPLPYDNIVYRSNPYNQHGEFQSLFGEIALQYPVFIGEFGSNGYPPMSNYDVEKLLEYATELGISWTAWNFHDTGCPCLLEDHKKFDFNEFGNIVYNALQESSLETSTILNNTEETDFGAMWPVYTDGFRWGFFDESWRTELDLMSTEKPLQGDNSIKLKYLDGSARFIMPTSWDVSTNDYSNLEFGINWNGQEPILIWVELENRVESNSRRVQLSEYIQLTEGNWNWVSIPLRNMIDSSFDINKIVLINAADRGSSYFYIDEIFLRK